MTKTHEKNGAGYRDIAKKMHDYGYPMNYTTAHNQFIRSIKKILISVCKDLDIPHDEKLIKELSKDHNIHEAIQNILYLNSRENNHD